MVAGWAVYEVDLQKLLFPKFILGVDSQSYKEFVSQKIDFSQG
jgi:hypothetical protein